MSRQSPSIAIQALVSDDLPAALKVQADTYPAFLHEEERVFLSRVNLQASYCLAAKQGNELLGYLLAHGWSRQSPPPLRTWLVDGGLSEVLFIHDLAVSPAKRGLGVGPRLISRAFELALRDGLRSAELVAVTGAAGYWRRLGFVEESASGELRDKLSSYGAGACWMTHPLHPL